MSKNEVIKLVLATYDDNDEQERATCPFCGEIARCEWTPLFLDQCVGCRHCEGFVEEVDLGIVVQFRGIS